MSVDQTAKRGCLVALDSCAGDDVFNEAFSYRSKAVADGALGFYCDHHVSARVSKFMYGVEYLREFDPNDSEHVSRKDRLCELPSGPRLLPDAFDCILARVGLSVF